jgi:hypothetical protein
MSTYADFKKEMQSLPKVISMAWAIGVPFVPPHCVLAGMAGFFAKQKDSSSNKYSGARAQFFCVL